MKSRTVTLTTTLLGLSILMGLSPLGSARAQTLNSKLADMASAVDSDSKATSQEEEAVAAPVDEAQQQALEAEVRDAVDHALENARNEQK